MTERRAKQRAAGLPARQTGSQPARHAPARQQPPSGASLLLALQRTAGNGAAVQAVQRLAGGDASPGTAAGTPARPVGVRPDDDPRFLSVKDRIAGEGVRLAGHPPPKAEARKAQQAAVAPADDKDAQAKAVHVEDMAGARPGGFDKAAFVAAVRQAVAAQAPRNLDEADRFGDSGRAVAIKQQVTGHVTEGRRESAREIADRTAQPPDPSVARDKPVTPLRDARPVSPRPAGAGTGMPAPAPAEQTDLTGGGRETQALMTGAGVTEEQLANSNEPQFLAALDAKRVGERHSATAPGHFRAVETRTLNATRQQANNAGAAGLGAMAQTRNRSFAATTAGKHAAKGRDEAARARISGYVRSVFDATKRDVDAILTGLDGAVARRFDAGEKAARDAFTADHKARMRRYKDERYSGLDGKARWVADLFTGLPAEANQIFAQSRTLYESRMLQVITDVADVIGTELTRAKNRIAAGRAEIRRYVAAQPHELRTVAQEAAGEFAAQFAQLESDVDSKRDALVEDLASRYTEARNAVDAEITSMQDANKGLWDKAKEAVGGAVQTILQLKEMLLGVLARAANAIGRIIQDPIGFLGNLVGAVRTGVTNFAANIVEHLKTGLQGWLLGSLSEAGVELPDKFDLKGIVQLVLSLLGVTWANIRARIVKQIPERVMAALEGSVEFIRVIATEGVGGLWKWIVEKLGDLREMVMDQIQDFVITKIVKAGITWLVSLLNPAAAFVRACKMIYDIVMFFVEKASQIKEFVDSILDSIESIASGGVGAVAGYIERTLARTLPVVLGFLASVLGLGGISDHIKKILQTIQRPIMAVVDSLVAGAIRVGKKLLGGPAAWVAGKAGAAKRWLGEKAGAAKEWAAARFGGARLPFEMAGEPHHLIVAPGETFALQVASTPRPVADALADELRRAEQEQAKHPDRGDARVVAVKGLIRQHREVQEAGEQHGAEDPKTKRLLMYLYEEMSRYGRRFNRRGFGYPRADEPEVGAQAPYERQAPGGKGEMIREHVVPGKLIAAFLGLTEGAFYDRFYRRMTTLVWEKSAADHKTDQHPRNDKAAIERVKRQRQAGETLFWSTIVHDRLAVTKESRDATGSTVTDEQINAAALAQLRETDDIQELAGRPRTQE
ncbi:MAG TPA: hypothetical protein VFR67_06720 [Pilimelia sp.]|nr:hypothetical protein [Pilimelia sp.]